jgi:hypothetical protein
MTAAGRTRATIAKIAKRLNKSRLRRAQPHGNSGFGGHGMYSAGATDAGKQRTNDECVKVASEEEARMLNNKLKSICNGF